MIHFCVNVNILLFEVVFRPDMGKRGNSTLTGFGKERWWLMGLLQERWCSDSTWIGHVVFWKDEGRRYYIIYGVLTRHEQERWYSNWIWAGEVNLLDMGTRYSDWLVMGRRGDVLTVHMHMGIRVGKCNSDWSWAECLRCHSDQTRAGEVYWYDMSMRNSVLTGDGQKKWCIDWTWTGDMVYWLRDGDSTVYWQ